METLPDALNDIKYWRPSGNAKIQKKIAGLITAISSDPFNGIGKPEPLKFEFAGCWSGRINSGHRIIYEVNGHAIEILPLKGHY